MTTPTPTPAAANPKPPPAAPAAPAPAMTVEDLLRMPRDGYRYELLNGELTKTMSAGYAHGLYASNIHMSLGAHVNERRLGRVVSAEATFLLAEDPAHARIPDVAFVSAARDAAVVDIESAFPGPPDLAVEVVSPSDRLTQVHEKALDWIARGARMVVVANPRRREAQVYRPGADVQTLRASDVLDGGDVVPGWRMPVADIFV